MLAGGGWEESYSVYLDERRYKIRGRKSEVHPLRDIAVGIVSPTKFPTFESEGINEPCD